MATKHGPPYAPTTAGVGGKPTIPLDVPIAAVFIVLYMGSVACNMIIFKKNMKRGHKFLFNIFLLQFSMARILTCALRIGTATHPSNISLSIAANILVNAGILIVYVVNVVLAQRILRARQPEIGWNPILRAVFKLLYFAIGIFLVLLITFIVLTFYTLNENLKETARSVQLGGLTYFLIFATLPLLILAVSYALPLSPRAENFGTGSMRAKALIIAFSGGLCTLNAGFKAGANWMPPRPVADPAWYQGKAPFWVFLFAIEVIILYFFLAVRIDRRFWVPDGSSTRRSCVLPEEEKKAAEFQQTESHSTISAGESTEPEKDGMV